MRISPRVVGMGVDGKMDVQLDASKASRIKTRRQLTSYPTSNTHFGRQYGKRALYRALWFASRRLSSAL